MAKQKIEVPPNPNAQSVEARFFAQQMGINPDLPIYDPMGAANQIVLNLLRDGKTIRNSQKYPTPQKAPQSTCVFPGKGCGPCGH